eukprot:2819483-Pyramimonas_sp.AAC.1
MINLLVRRAQVPQPPLDVSEDHKRVTAFRLDKWGEHHHLGGSISGASVTTAAVPSDDTNNSSGSRPSRRKLPAPISFKCFLCGECTMPHASRDCSCYCTP